MFPKLLTTSRRASTVGFGLFIGIFLATFLREDSFAAGVTVITHGYGGNADGWVAAMAKDVPHYRSFPGTNFTIYKITLTTDGTDYFYQWGPTNATPPRATDSGEIIVKLDWSQMAGGTSADYDISTYDVAVIATHVLMQTNAIPQLAGHALAEFPLHLIGHSRGGSLVCEMSHILGTNGVWVDHLTTLDPHPVNNDGFIDPLFVTDAPAHTYANVLFHDNYWEDINTYPWGESVDGAYVRPINSSLESDPGGYDSNYHSDVHLWYHGTINLNTPMSYDLDGDAAAIDASMRTSWWVSKESSGSHAGFLYSLIGGGNRLSTEQPLGPGYSSVREGYNQRWDLGAGAVNNRTGLTPNSGAWPNIIKLNVTGTNVVTAGDPIVARFYYQYGGVASNVTCQFFLDADFNPFRSNSLMTSQFLLTNTSVRSVMMVDVSLNTSNAPAGRYGLYAKISSGSRNRYLYAPELVQVMAPPQPLVLAINAVSPTQFQIEVKGVIGGTIVLESSFDLKSWAPFASNTVVSGPWIYTNNAVPTLPVAFYRAVLDR